MTTERVSEAQLLDLAREARQSADDMKRLFPGNTLTIKAGFIAAAYEELLDRRALSALEPAEPVAVGQDAVTDIGTTLNFFASVIKSGEPWTETCQKEYDNAHASLRSLSVSPSPAEPVEEEAAAALEVAGWTDKLLSELASKDPWGYGDQMRARGLLMSFKGILSAILRASPLPEQRVTDEMVERAGRALYETDSAWDAALPWSDLPKFDRDTHCELGRAALTAALTKGGQ